MLASLPPDTAHLVAAAIANNRLSTSVSQQLSPPQGCATPQQQAAAPPSTLTDRSATASGESPPAPLLSQLANLAAASEGSTILEDTAENTGRQEALSNSQLVSAANRVLSTVDPAIFQVPYLSNSKHPKYVPVVRPVPCSCP